jgi:hypothetical protein
MMALPSALQRGGPMSLDLFRRFGWELLCEPRVSVIGLQIVPLLAVRCSLLHSLVLVLSLSLCLCLSLYLFLSLLSMSYCGLAFALACLGKVQKSIFCPA